MWSYSLGKLYYIVYINVSSILLGYWISCYPFIYIDILYLSIEILIRWTIFGFNFPLKAKSPKICMKHVLNLASKGETDVVVY